MYLQNPHATDLSAQIEAWMAKQPEAEYCWLLDGSQLEAPDRRWLQRHATPWQSAFEGGPMAELADQGILLWSGNLPSQSWWPEWLALTSGRPQLSVIECRDGLPSSDFWHWLSQLGTEDGTSLVLRFADTHTLANALPLLNEEQQALVSSHIARWGWVGRDGNWEAYAFQPAQPTATPWPPLLFNDEQYEQLMQRAHPDMLVPVLQHFEVELPELSPAALHQRLDGLSAALREYGIEDTPSQALFTSIAFEQGDDFHEHPEWQTHWQQTRAGKPLTRILIDINEN
ncbi:hypothetical protein DK842_12115 [Chromobacterium phragmitis]|uniref:DUF4123 domain-containing protein n=1 Tax=Chromobacterium phragmitis TaxID=2202141 RepID=UPI000DEC97F5|nr:DUF4123 domain-containing protein [Chromobacterium phragmitis]AXE30582.1 hypothetical protein DK842_12115 [Chromobacterium phragmitis]